MVSPGVLHGQTLSSLSVIKTGHPPAPFFPLVAQCLRPKRGTLLEIFFLVCYREQPGGSGLRQRSPGAKGTEFKEALTLGFRTVQAQYLQESENVTL